jgi:hypothetical protein
MSDGLTPNQRLGALEVGQEFLTKEYEVIKAALDENTSMTKAIKENTDALIVAFNTVRTLNKAILAFFKWLGIIGGGIAGLVSAVYAISHVL